MYLCRCWIQLLCVKCFSFWVCQSVLSWKSGVTKPVHFMGILHSLSDACAPSRTKPSGVIAKIHSSPLKKRYSGNSRAVLTACRRFHFSQTKITQWEWLRCVLVKVKKVPEKLKRRASTHARHLVPAVFVCILGSACDAHRCLSRLKGLRIPRASAWQMQISWAYYDGCAASALTLARGSEYSGCSL